MLDRVQYISVYVNVNLFTPLYNTSKKYMKVCYELLSSTFKLPERKNKWWEGGVCQRGNHFFLHFFGGGDLTLHSHFSVLLQDLYKCGRIVNFYVIYAPIYGY